MGWSIHKKSMYDVLFGTYFNSQSINIIIEKDILVIELIYLYCLEMCKCFCTRLWPYTDWFQVHIHWQCCVGYCLQCGIFSLQHTR